MNNQTTEQLKRIDAKRTLGLPLTPSENAFYTLYGNFETIAAPLVDVIKADPADLEPSEATQKTAFVHGYLSPLYGRRDLTSITQSIVSTPTQTRKL